MQLPPIIPTTEAQDPITHETIQLLGMIEIFRRCKKSSFAQGEKLLNIDLLQWFKIHDGMKIL